jgi:hypothetical protein
VFEWCPGRWMAPALVAAVWLLGCVTTPTQLSQLSDLDLCRGYGVYSQRSVFGSLAQKYRQEMERRKLLTPEEWALAAERRIQKDMSQCALYASWGKPVREHQREEGGAVLIRHVYRMGWNMRPGSVFTRNGRVDGWSY